MTGIRRPSLVAVMLAAATPADRLVFPAGLVGCSGTTTGPSPFSAPIDASAAGDGTAPTNTCPPPPNVGPSGNDATAPDSSAPTDATEPPTKPPPGVDAMPLSWDGRVPLQHRVSSAQCPQARSPGTPCADDEERSPTDFACAQDSDCKMGVNGRCLSVPQLASCGQQATGGVYCETVCSYDACRSDSDCPTRTPCACRFSSIYGSPNVCLTASNCAIDADCGPGGFCSPSPVVGLADLAYFCHTQDDLCIDDLDCISPAQAVPGRCEFDTTSGRWTCRVIPGRL